MENSREGTHSFRLGEEFQDETGVELSLGLSLSSADSRSKWKASEGATRCSPSVDVAGEPMAGVPLNGMHSVGKPKPLNKAGGLESALKKFLEGRLDDHEDNTKLLEYGSNSFNLQREKDKASSTGLQDKPLDMAPHSENKGNPFLFKELQGSSGLITSRGQSPVHTTPLQLVDAFKSSPFVSNSGSPHSAEGRDNFHGDDGMQDTSEQHKDFQDAWKKRKHLSEDQNHQKKGKKEDSYGTHGFCLPRSNSIVTASAKDMDEASLVLRGDAGNKHIQQSASRQNQDSAEAERESDGDEGNGFGKNVHAGLGQNDTKGASDESKGVDVNFIPQLKALENLQKTGERSLKGGSTSPNVGRDGEALVIGGEADKASSFLQPTRERVPSETSSVSTGGTEKMEEKSRGEASSSAPEVTGCSKGSPPPSVLAGPFRPPAAPTSNASIPYPVSPYPVVPIPYALPVSVPHTPRMPFPVGVNFPYMMPYLPTGSESTEQSPTRPVGNNAFRQSGTEHQPPQLLEGTSWIQALRPPVSHLMNTSNGSLYNRHEMVEDGNIRLQAVTRMQDSGTVTRMQDSGVVNSSIAVDNSSPLNHPLFPAPVRNGIKDQVPDAPMLSSMPFPAVPHFTSHLGIPDHAELRISKEQTCTSTFPGFTATVQGAQAHSSPGPARPPSSSGVKEDVGQEQVNFGAGRSMPPAIQHNMQYRNILETSNLDREESRRAAGSQCYQGSTNNLSSRDGLGEDIPFLRSGLAPGLKFGGSGSAPDLPWVHTVGPNGQTLCGVLYRCNRTQLRVVCACHGKHMSPVEFAQHAGDLDTANVDKSVAVNSPLTTHVS